MTRRKETRSRTEKQKRSGGEVDPEGNTIASAEHRSSSCRSTGSWMSMRTTKERDLRLSIAQRTVRLGGNKLPLLLQRMKEPADRR